MATRYYNLENEAKAYLKACNDRGIVNQTSTKILNDYIIARKNNNLDASFLSRSPIALNGLVLWLDASNRQSYPSFGTNWRDLTERNLNTSLFSSFSSIPSDNVYGGRIYFQGTSGSTNIGNIATFPTWTQLGLSTSFTISVWFSFTRYSPNFFDFLFSCESYLNRGFRSGIANASNRIGFFSTQSGGTLSLTTNYVVPLNTPFNYTITFNANVGRTYINGVYDNQSTGTFISPNASDAFYYNFVGGGLKSDTYISAIQVYNRALTPQEALQNYNAQRSRFGL
jgi:hypothetical protein